MSVQKWTLCFMLLLIINGLLVWHGYCIVYRQIIIVNDMRYLKQALAMMREERLFSGIYIAGTALAIAFTMVMAVVYYIKLAPIYPEANRARTVYFEGLRIEAESRGMGQTGFSSQARLLMPRPTA